jgi:hypothetical protein
MLTVNWRHLYGRCGWRTFLQSSSLQAFQEVRDSLDGDVSVLVNDIYDNSIYASKEALEAWLETMDAEATC